MILDTARWSNSSLKPLQARANRYWSCCRWLLTFFQNYNRFANWEMGTSEEEIFDYPLADHNTEISSDTTDAHVLSFYKQLWIAQGLIMVKVTGVVQSLFMEMELLYSEEELNQSLELDIYANAMSSDQVSLRVEVVGKKVVNVGGSPLGAKGNHCDGEKGNAAKACCLYGRWSQSWLHLQQNKARSIALDTYCSQHKGTYSPIYIFRLLYSTVEHRAARELMVEGVKNYHKSPLHHSYSPFSSHAKKSHACPKGLMWNFTSCQSVIWSWLVCWLFQIVQYLEARLYVRWNSVRQMK